MKTQEGTRQLLSLKREVMLLNNPFQISCPSSLSVSRREDPSKLDLTLGLLSLHQESYERRESWIKANRREKSIKRGPPNNCISFEYHNPS
jgi:hypothetical protein